MDEKRIQQEGAFIVDNRPCPPRLVCGQCGSAELVGVETTIRDRVTATKVVCQECGAVYFVVGRLPDGV